MVADMELKPDEIETLRTGMTLWSTAEDRRLALAILDRLTPAPEVDEATKVWRGMMDAGTRARNQGLNSYDYLGGGWDDSPGVPEEIAHLREVLAAKDVRRNYEVEFAQQRADENDVRARKAEDELATLRAENERKPVVMKADRKVDAQALRTLADYIESDTHLKPGNKLSWSYYLEGIRRHYLKAAERNTAEQKGGAECSPEVDLSPALVDRAEQSAEPPAESWSVIDSVPAGPAAVEVTQEDRDMAIRFDSAIFALERGPDRIAALASLLMTYRTEAEARGRREALEDIELIPQRVKEMIGATEMQNLALRYCEAELRSFKRMMTEVK